MDWGWKDGVGGLWVWRRGRVGRRGLLERSESTGHSPNGPAAGKNPREHYSRLVDYLSLNKTKPGDLTLPKENLKTFFRIDTNLRALFVAAASQDKIKSHYVACLYK